MALYIIRCKAHFWVKIAEYHKRGSQNATTVRFPTSKNHRTFAPSIRTNALADEFI